MLTEDDLEVIKTVVQHNSGCLFLEIIQETTVDEDLELLFTIYNPTNQLVYDLDFTALKEKLHSHAYAGYLLNYLSSALLGVVLREIQKDLSFH